jgi:Ni/Co efflux regulator RcnB
MKKTLIACLIASIVATSLTGCGKSQEELKKEADLAAYHQMLQDQAQQKQEDEQAAALAAEQAAADEKELNGVVAELKKGDPLIRDAYYGYNEKGDRVLHVIRDNPPAPAPTVQAAPMGGYAGGNGQPVIINNTPAPQAHSGFTETVLPMLAGAGAGMMLANAINGGGGFDRYRDSHPGYNSRNWDNDNDYRRERTTVVNQYHTTNVRNVTTAYKNPESPTAKAFAAQTGYKPRVVAQSSNYTPGRVAASPTNRQAVQQPKQVAAKPLTNPQVNSYWDNKPKAQPAAQPKPAAQTNSYWNSAPAAKPANSSGYSSGGSSSGYTAKASPARTPTVSRPSPARSPSRR